MRTLKQQAIAKAAGLVDYQVVPPPEVKMVSEIMRENGYYTTNNSKEDYQFFKSELAWDESSGYAHWRNRPNKEMPFFPSLTRMLPTNQICGVRSIERRSRCIPPPRTAESQWEKLGYKNYQAYKNDTIPLQVPEDLSVEVPPYLPQNEIGENAMRKLYSNIVRMDRFMGILLQQLEEDGLLEETIIVWDSDHGGPLPRQKRLLYDSGLRVPLIIRYPNKLRAGERDDRLISFVDYPPTLLSMVGIEPPSYMEGQAERKI